MTHAVLINGVWREIVGPFEDADGTQHAANVPELWSAEELEAIGVKPLVDRTGEPVPGSQRVMGVELVDVEGAPTKILTVEPVDVAGRRGPLLAKIRDTRWTHEQAGFTGPNGHVRTDDPTQGKVTGAVQLFTLNPALTALDWEVAPGVFATIPRASVEAMGVAIGLHVQACFTRSRQLTEAVLAATTHTQLDTIEAQIEEGWPS
jgi:hypothetical protein